MGSTQASIHTKWSPTDTIELSRYPIDDLSSAFAADFLIRCQREWQTTGACQLPGFISAKAVTTMVDEIEAVLERVFVCESTHNAYLKKHDDARFGPQHPRNRPLFTRVGSIAQDDLPRNSLLHQLYRWAPLADFIGKVIDQAPLYLSGDPLGAVSVNVFADNDAHAWHFDEAEFTVTILLQPSERGGHFEYIPNLREKGHKGVREVLDGRLGAARKIPFVPGTLLLFNGHQSLHRVTQIKGPRRRLVPVLCYASQPNTVNSDAVRSLFWGRTSPRD